MIAGLGNHPATITIKRKHTTTKNKKERRYQMTQYKIGTRINLQKKAQRKAKIEQIKADLYNSLFWAGLVLMFLYCLFTPQQ